MTFLISFLNEGSKRRVKELTTGQIVIGDFVEKFEASLSYWTKSDYEKHWAEGIERIIKGYSKSCLITSMIDPQKAKFIIWWPMYREDEKVIFHNQLLFMDPIEQPFNPESPYSYIDDPISVDEEGNHISKWEISITDLEIFLIKLKER